MSDMNRICVGNLYLVLIEHKVTSIPKVFSEHIIHFPVVLLGSVIDWRSNSSSKDKDVLLSRLRTQSGCYWRSWTIGNPR